MHPPPTERLRFREMTSGDFPLMKALLGDPRVMEFYPRPKSDDEVRRWIDSTLRSYAVHGHALWVLELSDDGTFIGDCGLTMQTVDGDQVLEVGYRLLPHFQGKGYATEAAAACVDYAFTTLEADYVTAIINPANVPSRRVAEGLGMTLDRTTSTADGRPIAVYGIHRHRPAP